MSGVRAFVSEPEADYFWSGAVLEQVHRQGVSEGMWGDAAIAQAWASELSLAKELVQAITNAKARKRLAESIGKDRSIAVKAVFFEPLPEQRACSSP